MGKKITKRDLVDELNDLVASGTSKTHIEKQCHLPANSLASVLTRKKAMPAKWVPKLTAFVGVPIITAEQKPVKTELVFKAPGSKKIETFELKTSDVDFKAPTQESYDNPGIAHTLIDEAGKWSAIGADAIDKINLHARISELEQRNAALVSDLRLISDNNAKLVQENHLLRTENNRLVQANEKLHLNAGKEPSLADVVMGHINKPTEDKAANLRAIKSGKGGKGAEK